MKHSRGTLGLTSQRLEANCTDDAFKHDKKSLKESGFEDFLRFLSNFLPPGLAFMAIKAIWAFDPLGKGSIKK